MIKSFSFIVIVKVDENDFTTNQLVEGIKDAMNHIPYTDAFLVSEVEVLPIEGVVEK